VNLWEVVRFSRWDEVAAGTVIMRDGERGDFFAFLLDGELAVSKCGHTLGTLAAGECFGEMAIIRRGEHTRGADVVAQTAAKRCHGFRAGAAARLGRLPDALLPGLSRRHRRAPGRRQRATRGTLTPDFGPIAAAIAAHTGIPFSPHSINPVAGGSIHEAWRVEDG
jgi:CRP-like cAMP-binding protein